MGEKENSPKFTKEELMQREYDQYLRDLCIKRMRASVVRSQVVRAYEIIENIRLDYLGDTMFRDYFTRVKKNLEGALGDFLLNDAYWEERIKKHRKMTPKEYNATIPLDDESKVK